MCGFDNAVTLHAGAWEACVVPAFGMNMVLLRCDGKVILREAGDMATLKDSPFLYGTPLLFPANRTAGGAFTFEGETYHLTVNEPNWNNHLHGLMYNAPFTVAKLSESSVTAVYENRGERYPFPFRLEITDTLDRAGMRRRITLTNTGSKTMPYTMAFHTSFREPERFTVQIGKKHERSATFVPTGRMEELNAQEQTYLTGCCPRGIAISGYFEAAGTDAYLDDIRFTASEGFDQRVLFNGGGEQGFLCIEPQAGWVNGLNIPSAHKVLGAGENAQYEITIGKVCAG